MSCGPNDLRDLYPPEQLQKLDAISTLLKANPKLLDTHSKDVRNLPVEENSDG
jgi:hypothetical protein